MIGANQLSPTASECLYGSPITTLYLTHVDGSNLPIILNTQLAKNPDTKPTQKSTIIYPPSSDCLEDTIVYKIVSTQMLKNPIDTSMVIDEMGFKFIRTRVGDTYVSEELKKGGDFGGEPSGSWVFPNISLCPDSIYAAAQIVAIASRQKLSQLVDSLPYYPILRGNINSDGVVMARLEQRLMAMKPLTVSDIDGIKLNFKDGWLLIRASGTEPKIRITAEANGWQVIDLMEDITVVFTHQLG